MAIEQIIGAVLHDENGEPGFVECGGGFDDIGMRYSTDDLEFTVESSEFWERRSVGSGHHFKGDAFVGFLIDCVEDDGSAPGGDDRIYEVSIAEGSSVIFESDCSFRKFEGTG
jgi:hypothetical protein